MRKLISVAIALVLTMDSFAQPDLQTLNLKETDITVLIGMVGEITGKTFIVDPRVTGPVTVIAQKPMNATEVYDIFLSVLRVHGFAAVPTGNVIKIVPDTTARQDIDGGAEVGGNRDELVTRVIDLQQVQANELLPIIKPMLPPQAQVVVHAGSNALIISDRLGNIERISAIIRRIDQRTDNSVEVIALNHASAGELQRTLNALMPGEQGSARVIADTRTNSLLMSGDPTTRLKLRAMVANLDTPLKQGDNTSVIYLKYADSKALVPLLNQVAQSLTFEQSAPAGDKRQGSVATIQAHEATNSLIVSGPSAVLRELTQVIDRLDVRPAQILIEAIVAEVSMDKASELGIQWQAADSNLNNGGLIGGTQFNGPNGTGNINSTAGGLSVNPFGALAALGGGLNLGYLSGFTTITGADGEEIRVAQLGALAKALRSDAGTNVLSTPSILTLDHKKAKILVGQEVPFLTGQYAQTGGSTTATGGTATTPGSVNPFQTIQRNNVGLTLTVTPHVNQGDTVLLEIRQEVSSVAPSSSGAVDLITNKREINTTVMVADGRTLVLGGLIDSDVKETVQKVPGLGDIPLVGNLFRYRSSQRVQRNLMIFIRPTIIGDQAEQDAVTAEKYNFIRDKQAAQRQNKETINQGEDLPLMPDIFDLQPAPKSD